MNKTAVVILTGVGTVQAWKTKASGERRSGLRPAETQSDAGMDI
jgi:hypothetical protein